MAFIIDRDRARRTFEDYTGRYDLTDKKIWLKVEHTYRVAELCERIAGSIGLAGQDLALAWLVGLLHDVGRFEQIKRYNTFIDAQSVDHAAFGAEILFAEGKIRDYITDDSEDKLMEDAVRFHNAYRLPKEMNGRTQIYADILRDADKIDILKVCSDISLADIYNVTTDEIMQSAISDGVIRSFYEEHAVPRQENRTPVDHQVAHISLVYELVYPISRQIVQEQGHLQKIMDFKSDNPRTRAQFTMIKEHMQSYLNG